MNCGGQLREVLRRVASFTPTTFSIFHFSTFSSSKYGHQRSKQLDCYNDSYNSLRVFVYHLRHTPFLWMRTPPEGLSTTVGIRHIIDLYG